MPSRSTLKLTESVVRGLKSHNGNRPQIFWDADLKGFGVLVSGKTGQRTYVVQRGQIPRRTIERANVISLAEARQRAMETLALLGQGIDPKRQARAAQLAAAAVAAQDRTLREALESYLKTRKGLRERTAKDYRRLLNEYTPDWLDQPLRSLTPLQIVERHERIRASVAERRATRLATGMTAANQTMRVVRALWNHALVMELVPGLGSNPVARLSNAKAWYPELRRKTTVRKEDLPRFYHGVCQLNNPVARDMILLMLFTGMRVGETCSLRWENIDLSARVFRVPGTVTKNKRDLELPMSDFVYELLSGRPEVGPWMFPGNGRFGHAEDPRAALRRIATDAGLPYRSAHDLRRTYITAANSSSLSHYEHKALVNHSLGQSDVTAGYIVEENADWLRSAAQKVTNRLKELIGLTPSLTLVRQAV